MTSATLTFAPSVIHQTVVHRSRQLFEESSNPVASTIFKRKPFGENVEGLSHCGDENYNSNLAFNSRCVTVKCSACIDENSFTAWQYVVQIQSTARMVGGRSAMQVGSAKSLVRIRFVVLKHRCEWSLFGRYRQCMIKR